MAEREQRTFKSVHHPDGTPAALVYGRALARPLLACALPVMIGALAVALQGRDALAFVVAGLPAALLVATAWTHFHLRRTPAEIRVRIAPHKGPDEAAVRSVADCLGRLAAPNWRPVLDLRLTKTAIQTSIGRTTYELSHAAWPDHDALLDALQQARDHARRVPVS